MANFWLPPESPIARAMRGWPSNALDKWHGSSFLYKPTAAWHYPNFISEAGTYAATDPATSNVVSTGLSFTTTNDSADLKNDTQWSPSGDDGLVVIEFTPISNPSAYRYFLCGDSSVGYLASFWGLYVDQLSTNDTAYFGGIKWQGSFIDHSIINSNLNRRLRIVVHFSKVTSNETIRYALFDATTNAQLDYGTLGPASATSQGVTYGGQTLGGRDNATDRYSGSIIHKVAFYESSPVARSLTGFNLLTAEAHAVFKDKPANDTPYLVATSGGAGTVTGTGSLESAVASVSGTGTVGRVGTGSLASQNSAIAGVGVREITGTAALTSQDSSVAGAGTVSGTVTGTGAIQSESSTIAGTGLREITGTGAVQALSSVVAGTGTVSGAVTGTGAIQAESASISGTGVREITSTGALQSAASSIAGTGIREVTGTGSVASQTSSVDGTGTVTAPGVITGSGALASQSSTIAGTGLLARDGTGSLQSGLAEIDATGIIGRTGTGSLTSQSSSIAGTGVVTTPGTVTGTAALSVGSSSISGTGTVTPLNPWAEIDTTTTIWTDIASGSTTWTEI